MTNMSQNIDIQNTTRIDALFERISSLIEQARNVVVYTAKSAEVKTRYEVGRYIFEDEQQGERAAYGKQVLKNLPVKLMNRFGDDWSYDTLKRCRFFFQAYENAVIGATTLPQLKDLGESAENKDANIYATAYQLYLPDKSLLRAKVKEWIKEYEDIYPEGTENSESLEGRSAVVRRS